MNGLHYHFIKSSSIFRLEFNNKMTANKTIIPPSISENVILSPRKIQTHRDPKMLSIKTRRLTSAAGKNGVAQVTNATPKPIVNTPIKKINQKSYELKTTPFPKIMEKEQP